jgi:hypothetical protein
VEAVGARQVDVQENEIRPVLFNDPVGFLSGGSGHHFRVRPPQAEAEVHYLDDIRLVVHYENLHALIALRTGGSSSMFQRVRLETLPMRYRDDPLAARFKWLTHRIVGSVTVPTG